MNWSGTKGPMTEVDMPVRSLFHRTFLREEPDIPYLITKAIAGALENRRPCGAGRFQSRGEHLLIGRTCQASPMLQRLCGADSGLRVSIKVVPLVLNVDLTFLVHIPLKHWLLPLGRSKAKSSTHRPQVQPATSNAAVNALTQTHRTRVLRRPNPIVEETEDEDA